MLLLTILTFLDYNDVFQQNKVQFVRKLTPKHAKFLKWFFLLQSFEIINQTIFDILLSIILKGNVLIITPILIGSPKKQKHKCIFLFRPPLKREYAILKHTFLKPSISLKYIIMTTKYFKPYFDLGTGWTHWPHWFECKWCHHNKYGWRQ